MSEMPETTEKLSELKIELAVTRKDIEQIREKIADVHKELEKIRGYFTKAIIGLVVIVGTYFIKWILAGGLSTVLPM